MLKPTKNDHFQVFLNRLGHVLQVFGAAYIRIAWNGKSATCISVHNGF